MAGIGDFLKEDYNSSALKISSQENKEKTKEINRSQTEGFLLRKIDGYLDYLMEKMRHWDDENS